MRSNKFSDGGARLMIGGARDMFERRVRDVIKAEFLNHVKDVVRTAPREFWPQRIAIRDTTSRWGSCSTSGTMSFSWRLAFAPLDVLRYVVMHELAHRKHMDHSPEFWATVRELYGFGVERAKRWLAQHGGELHRYF
jgi:predicted metal-dependent hydrolase